MIGGDFWNWWKFLGQTLHQSNTQFNFKLTKNITQAYYSDTNILYVKWELFRAWGVLSVNKMAAASTKRDDGQRKNSEI